MIVPQQTGTILYILLSNSSNSILQGHRSSRQLDEHERTLEFRPATISQL